MMWENVLTGCCLELLSAKVFRALNNEDRNRLDLTWLDLVEIDNLVLVVEKVFPGLRKLVQSEGLKVILEVKYSLKSMSFSWIWGWIQFFGAVENLQLKSEPSLGRSTSTRHTSGNTT
jgi:hypothetical protein